MTEEEIASMVQAEFSIVMDEWGFRPWRDGEIAPVTAEEAAGHARRVLGVPA